jgi:hypothetical protein
MQLPVISFALLLSVLVGAIPAAAQKLSASGERDWQDYTNAPPHKAFAIAANGNGYWWGRVSAADLKRAPEQAISVCEEKSKGKCTLYAYNNIILNGRDWPSATPPAAPAIGRLKPQPMWVIKGPQAAPGLVVWSHGYMSGVDATANAAQWHVGYFSGYDMYRFDREWIRDWPGDATALAEAVRQARSMGYKRIVLAGQSAGAWVSIAATMRGAPVDGVISTAAAHHGELKDMRDPSIPLSEWKTIVNGIKPGPRLVVINFAKDTYDVGSRMEAAKAAFAANGVDAVVIAEPVGFEGHNAGNNIAFSRKFGACIKVFIDTSVRRAPCS